MGPKRLFLAILLSAGVVLGYGSALGHAVHHGGWHHDAPCGQVETGPAQPSP